MGIGLGQTANLCDDPPFPIPISSAVGWIAGLALAAPPVFIGLFVVAAARAMVRGDKSWCARATGLACAVAVVAIGGDFDAQRASPTGARPA